MEPNLFRYAWRFSKREQMLVFGLILLSLPFNWISFEIPKRIVNDAIQGRSFKDGHNVAMLFDWTFTLPDFLGGGTILQFPGFSFGQLNYLFVLSGLFLLFVLINGWFKYSINIRKGILGERMLRRLRFDLFQQLMRFRPEEMRSVKAAEVASMIKDEVDPIGGFIGDAFIQPVFLATQAITPLVFIMFQNVLLGLVALGIVLVQGVIIPRLRVEQLRLGRERQLLSRQLAGRIGEMVEGAPVIHAHDVVRYSEAEIGGRLGQLYGIRVNLFRRKFSVKYLNNLLAQVTPFFFYAIGGYFAIRKQLDIGQLVAVIAAYRDLPPPVKDLIDWDQERNDVTIKYEQVVAQFSPPKLLPFSGSLPVAAPEATGIHLAGLKVVDGRGNVSLDRLTLDLTAGSHVAINGRGAGADAFMKVLGRQITEYQGRVEIGGQEVAGFSDAAFAASFAYVGPDTHIFPGSVRDNIILSLLRSPPPPMDEESLSKPHRLEAIEARRTGNPVVSDKADWVDYAAAGVADAASLDAAIRKLLEDLEADDDIFRIGIYGLLADGADGELEEAFVEARKVLRARLDNDRMNALIEPFDLERYNNSSSIADNLLFGVPRGSRLASGALAKDVFVRAILRSEALIGPLSEMGYRIAQWTADTFGNLRAMPRLANRANLLNDEDVDGLKTMLEALEIRGGMQNCPEDIRNRLISLALTYIEPQHRLGLLDEEFKLRIVRARHSFRRFLPHDYHDAIEFYDPGKFNRSARILDNLLFGRVVFGVGNAQKRVAQLCEAVLRQQGLDSTLFRIGLDRPAGVRGQLLTPQLRCLIDIARALIRRPSMLVLDNTLSSFGSAEAEATMRQIKSLMKGRLLIATLPENMEPKGFDPVLEFEGAVLRKASGATDVRQRADNVSAPAA